MLISSRQHRNLQRYFIVAIVTLTVISCLIWVVVTKNVESTMLNAAKNNTQTISFAIRSSLYSSQLKNINKLSLLVESNKNSGKLSERILIDLTDALKSYELSATSLVEPNEKWVVSTNKVTLPEKVISEEIIETLREKDTYNITTGGNVISYIPIYNYAVQKNNIDKKKNNQKIVAILIIVKNNSLMIKEIDFINYFLLASLLSGSIILMMVFYFTAKYSDNLVSKYAKQIVTQAKSDPVTGLLNRHHFFRFIGKSVDKVLQQNGHSALLFIDIDHFKELNAKYDHSFGDEVLKILVQRLSRTLGHTDILARTGDDEFSIFIEESESTPRVKDFARQILDRVNEPIQIDAHYIHLTCSIGISVLNKDAKDMEQMIQHADSALYNAKDFGRNNFQVFSRGGGTRHIKFYERQYSLNKALDDDEFVLHIQPRVNGETSDIVGGESLLRWNNPDFGLIPPLEFLPALESSGLIHNVGRWVLDESCKICKGWQDKGLGSIPISVNVSALQFKKENFVDIVSEVLRSTELDGELLEIELTETCLMDNVEQTLVVLNGLKALGVKIVIDDFGTGYSSLSYLKRFPIDVLKIDRSFITNIDNRTQHENAAIVTAIMAMSHSLHLDVVAEGVETANELAYLNALGCKHIQGFLFSKAIPREDFDLLLKNKAILLERLEDIRSKLA